MAQAATINTADKDLTEWGKAIDEELVEVKTLEEEVFEPSHSTVGMVQGDGC
jgi:hypothetical protein